MVTVAVTVISYSDAAQPLARQQRATAQSKAHRRRRLSVYGSPVVILAQKAAFCKKT